MQRIVDVALITADRIGASGEGPHGGLLLVGVFEEEPPAGEAFPSPIADLLRSLGERPGWKGRDGQWVEGGSGREDVPRVALRGMGKRDQLHVRKLAKWLTEV